MSTRLEPWSRLSCRHNFKLSRGTIDWAAPTALTLNAGHLRFRTRLEAWSELSYRYDSFHFRGTRSDCIDYNCRSSAVAQTTGTVKQNLLRVPWKGYNSQDTMTRCPFRFLDDLCWVCFLVLRFDHEHSYTTSRLLFHHHCHYSTSTLLALTQFVLHRLSLKKCRFNVQYWGHHCNYWSRCSSTNHCAVNRPLFRTLKWRHTNVLYITTSDISFHPRKMHMVVSQNTRPPRFSHGCCIVRRLGWKFMRLPSTLEEVFRPSA
jgi:hypothetical protein